MNFLSKYPKHKVVLVLFDWLVINLSFMGALFLRFYFGAPFLNFFGLVYSEKWLWFLPFSFVISAYFQYSDLYKFQVIRFPKNHIFLIIKTVVQSVGAYILFQFTLKDYNIESRLFYIYLISFASIGLLGFRYFFAKKLLAQPFFRDRIAIVSAASISPQLVNSLCDEGNYQIVGFLDEINKGSTISQIGYLGKISDAVAIAKNNGIQSFVVADTTMAREDFFKLFSFFQSSGLVLAISSDYLKVLHQKVILDVYGNFSLVRFCANQSHGFLHLLKRLLDVFLTIVGILILAYRY